MFYRVAVVVLVCLIALFSMGMIDSGGAPGGPLPKPVPTPDGWMVTAQMTVRRCLQYERIVQHWLNMDMSVNDAFDVLDNSHLPLIMAIMAKESSCIEHATDGLSYGLMQVIPRDWLPNAYHNNTNVLAGLYILDGSLELADGDVELALAYYNCGVPKVENDACGKRGGVHYAADILSFWLPLFSP
jgi:hypothetical protein